MSPDCPDQAAATWEGDGAWETVLCPQLMDARLSTCPGDKPAPDSKGGPSHLSCESRKESGTS